MQVLELQIKNFLGIKAVAIKPDNRVIRIEGKNGQGKTSVIDAIWAAIGGKDAMPDQPLRKGEKEGKIYIDLGDIRVTRRFTEKGTYLEVTNADGLKHGSPQGVLDKLFTNVSIDPYNFCTMRPPERREALLSLTGKRAEIEKLETLEKARFDERTLVNRDIKTLEGKLAGAPETTGDEREISVSELMAELNTRRENNRLLDGVSGTVDCLKSDIDEIVGQIERLKGQLDIYKRKLTAAEKELSGMAKMDTAEIEQQISTADEHNARVRSGRAVQEQRKELLALQSKADSLTAEIEKARTDKATFLSIDKLPIAGLEVDGNEISVNGIPFDDLSASEQLKMSLQIGIAQNPQLKVLRIERGSELDSASMAEVEAFANQADYQVWIERVAEECQGGIYIENGEVKSEEFALR